MMKSISNTTRRIALVILLLILVVIMATCQGGIKGTNNSPSAGTGNPGNTAALATFSNGTIQETAYFLSNCAACHADRNTAEKTVSVSPLITLPAVSPLVNIVVDANP